MARATATVETEPVVEPVTGEVPAPEAPAGMAHETDLVAASLRIFNDEWEGLTLQQKIARITGHVGTIPKRGYNAFHKYHYVTEGDLVGSVRQYLSAAGIAIIPDVVKVKLYRENTENPLTEVIVNYTVTDGKEEFSFRMPGHGADKGDKGVYKAITGSQKYALMKLFKIETGDDPESDTRVDERSAQSQGPRQAPRVSTGNRGNVTRGAHSSKASPVQLRKISSLSQMLGLTREEVVIQITAATGIEIVLPDDETKQSETIVAALKETVPEDATKIIEQLESLAAERADTANDGSDGIGYG